MGSDGFRRLEMEWEAWCVIPWCVGFSSSDAWSRGSVGIFVTSLGFARCFRKPLSILQVNFEAWRWFRSLEVISQSFRSPKVISQPKWSFAAQRWWKEGKKIFATVSQLQNTLRNGALATELGVFLLRNYFAAAKKPAKWSFSCEIESFLCFAAVSQLRNEGHYAAKWHSCAKKWLRNCEILCEMELSLRKLDLSCFGGSQPFCSCEMGVTVLRNGTRVPKLVSQLRNTLRNGALAVKLGIFTLSSFATVS